MFSSVARRPRAGDQLNFKGAWVQSPRLALGTAALGMEYGYGYCRGRIQDSISFIRHAYTEGIRYFDTAGGYGDAEILLGRALAGTTDAVICSKFPLPQVKATQLAASLERAVVHSLRRLKRECLPLLKLHNMTVQQTGMPGLDDALATLVHKQRVQSVGVSVYQQHEVQASLQLDMIRTVQAPYNMLNGAIANTMLHELASRRVAFWARSVFLQGALSEQIHVFPKALQPLKKHILHIKSELGCPWHMLPQIALRYCIQPGVAVILLGLRNRIELQQALAAVSQGPLPGALRTFIIRQQCKTGCWVDPRTWP